ncbi:aldehyde dehydrogenase [Clostridium rectalis]|uniref:aldehyde dehydrogenase n=1 Tax=Clostridium rectalis TaxID=2040295 RepID=UPI000F6315E8|nr:aldehyde dehydrogenase [Clostridium rectalis]
MSKENIDNIIKNQHIFFNSGATLDISFRIKQLRKLKQLILSNENIIFNALSKDLHKSKFESYISEIGFVINEINHTISHLKKWCRVEKVKTPWIHFPGKSYILKEPYGNILIIGPWNYPFHLIFAPIIGAMSAGNCIIIKPSEISNNVSKVITNIINKNFSSSFIYSYEGGIEETNLLLSYKWDYIFFTGSNTVGKLIMKKASENLTPVTLELGGKSPCIIDENINIKTAARRLIWGKFFNSGQTCVAPDYAFIHKNILKEFIEELKITIKEFYGTHIISSTYYGRIINKKHYIRLINYMNYGKVIFGGKYNETSLYISPTLIINTPLDSCIMNEEIFGPILPLFKYDNLSSVVQFINNKPKPLSLYFFSKDNKKINFVLKNTSSGSVCINETLSQISSPYLPFGGVGNSGMGKYHGKYSYDSFSHKKSVMEKNYFLDLKLKYPPYKTPISFIKKIL